MDGVNVLPPCEPGGSGDCSGNSETCACVCHVSYGIIDKADRKSWHDEFWNIPTQDDDYGE